jgi:hypothetical protein
MSQQITTAFVKQFGANIYFLAQQKGSRLRGAVRNEMQVGDTAYYDQIGAVAAVLKTSRYSNTPQIDTPHSRRAVTMSDYEWADLIDKQDKIRTLIDPQSAYVQSAVWAMGRSMDDVIIQAATGTSQTGVSGATSVPLPVAQQYACNDGTNFSNLNVNSLRGIKQIFDLNDVDESIPRYIACSGSQIQSLLVETQITSADYNTVKALVEGKIDTFMGFKFIRTQRLNTFVSGSVSASAATGAVSAGTNFTFTTGRSVIAWAQDGILLSTGMDITARVDERTDKSYATQCYASMSLGATRMEEVKVVQAIAIEAA